MWSERLQLALLSSSNIGNLLDILKIFEDCIVDLENLGSIEFEPKKTQTKTETDYSSES